MQLVHVVVVAVVAVVVVVVVVVVVPVFRFGGGVAGGAYKNCLTKVTGKVNIVSLSVCVYF